MFTLTSEERRIVVFVVGAFLVGLWMKECRQARQNAFPPAATASPTAPAKPKASPPPADEAAYPNPD